MSRCFLFPVLFLFSFSFSLWCCLVWFCGFSCSFSSSVSFLFSLVPLPLGMSCFSLVFFHTSANMVYSSRSTHIIRERSRSRDNSMWQPHPSQRHNAFRDSWQEVPAPPRLRDVLIIVNLEGVRSHMTRIHDDIMERTTCAALPLLGRQEEHALFTCNVLITTQT